MYRELYFVDIVVSLFEENKTFCQDLTRVILLPSYHNQPFGRARLYLRQIGAANLPTNI